MRARWDKSPVILAMIDPVPAGYVAGLSRLGGNYTGFAAINYGTTGKCLLLLKQIAPNVAGGIVIEC